MHQYLKNSTHQKTIKNCEIPDVQAGFRQGIGTRDQIANIHCIIKKVREFQINIYFCFIDYAKPLTVQITTNCGKFWERWKYHLISTTMAIILKKERDNQCWWGCGESLHIAGWNVNGTDTENCLVVLQKVKQNYHVTQWSISRYISKRTENRYIQIYVYTC